MAALGGGEGGAGGGEGGGEQEGDVPLDTKVKPLVQGLPPHTPVLPLTSSRVRAVIP